MPRLLGGSLALDFINTVDPRHATRRTDYIPDYEALAEWAAYAGAVEQSAVERLQRVARSRSSAAISVHRRTRALREASYGAIASALRDQPPRAVDVGCISRELARARAGERLRHDGNSFIVDAVAASEPLELLLGPVALAIGGLLVSADLSRVRECPGDDGCGWLFLDTSRNGRRRWCSMQVCGNRAKARRHHAAYA